MTVAEFRAVAEGYVRANSASDSKRLTEHEKDDLFQFVLEDRQVKPRTLQTWRFDRRGFLVPHRRVIFQG